jgi:hypothetical protein
MDTDFPSPQGWHLCRLRLQKFQRSVGATSSEYAAPTGLKFCLGCGSTNMSRRWRFGLRRRVSALKARTCPRTLNPNAAVLVFVY